MSREKAAQRSTGKRLTFLGPRNLVAWLESPAGREVRETIEGRWLPTLAAKLFDGSEESKQLQAEVLERHGKETRCLIVASPMENGSVYLEMYGPRELKIHVITLPVVPATVECQRVAEQLVELELPRTYKPLFYPSGKRRVEVIEVIDAHAYFEREQKREADRLFSKALDEVKK